MSTVFLTVIGFFPINAQEQPSQTLKERLRAQIQALEAELERVQKEERTLTKTIDILNSQINQQEIELRQLALAIRQINLNIKETEEAVQILSNDIISRKKALSKNILVLDQFEQASLIEILLKNRRLSDFFEAINQIENVQSQILNNLNKIKVFKTELEQKKDALAQQSQEYSRLRALELAQKRSLEANKKAKQNILTSKRKEIAVKKRDLAALKSQLFYLEKTGISVEDAVKFAELAAERVGIRPAFLLAVLEVETGRQFENQKFTLATNLGTGNWRQDMYQCYINLGKRRTAERQKRAYFQITSELNYDPDTMPVSRRPRYGCGGAMGPAQFIPTTWLLYKNRVAKLTGHNPPDPWNVEDAFTAAALFLADAGATAKTFTAEKKAAKTYISGNPHCSSYICNIYSSNILSLTEVIERHL